MLGGGGWQKTKVRFFECEGSSANNPCIAIEGAQLLCQAVEVVEDGIIGVGWHAVHLAYI